VNDQYSSATDAPLSGGAFTDTVDTATFPADAELVPGSSGLAGGHGAWWSFTAPADALYLFSVHGPAPTVLQLFTQPAGTAVQYAGSANDTIAADSGRVPANTARFNARTTAGTTYWLRAAPAGDPGQLTVAITQAAATTSHSWLDAVAVTPAPAPVGGFDSGPVDVAAADTSEDNPTGGTLRGHRACWFAYVPAFGRTVSCAVLSDDGTGNYDPDNNEPLYLDVWSLVAGTWTPLVSESGIVQYGQSSGFAARTGVRHLLRVAGGAAVQLLRLTVGGAAPAGAEGPPPDNHQYADALTITPDSGGAWWAGVDNTGYDAAETAPPAMTLLGTQALWWRYTPPDDATEIEIIGQGQHHGVVLTLYAVDAGGVWSQVATNDVASPTAHAQLNPALLSAGTTYYLRAANRDDYDYVIDPGDGQSLALTLTGSPPPPPPPPPLVLDVPPLLVDVQPVPPAAEATAPAAYRLTLREPADAAVLPTGDVTFLVVVQPTGDPGSVTVQVQYDGATIVSADADLVYGSALVTLAAAAPLADGPHTFRARALVDDLAPGPWSAARAFTVAAEPAVDVPVTWTVTAGTPAPHLWLLTPAAAQPGQKVTVLGHGLGTGGTVRLGGNPVEVASWTAVAGAGAGAGRVIDETRVDAEHTAVVITVPQLGGPGAALVVEPGGSGGYGTGGYGTGGYGSAG
jgi:hypothetical protein